ncbi:uncharacterized protein K452DRAFT_5794 [Aplosporella prunicola CBS 121167]|uniref:Uncharacterized protein n=1 Tax=Aplosporella prunicola CBS 121167 TaxID=1176127 RepID=A0A6A6BWR8_9PEZI|nr:uncharacterized protein K452DRAFT_5794 [Aplosporella prunicola CBS 121167]KAF2147347.1 hypothetical protein K452DRAFT_5794 [Aplosporella prunicola CBS 121167]
MVRGVHIYTFTFFLSIFLFPVPRIEDTVQDTRQPVPQHRSFDGSWKEDRTARRRSAAAYCIVHRQPGVGIPTYLLRTYGLALRLAPHRIA